MCEDVTEAGYVRRIESDDEILRVQSSHDLWYSRARGIVFLICLAFALAGWFRLAPFRAMMWAAAASFACFVAVVYRHESLRELMAMTRTQRLLQNRQLHRYRRDWSRVPEPVVDVPEEHAGVARDLDLMGRASVFQWLSRTHTPRGKRLLRDWLLDAADPIEVSERQDAVKKLAQMQGLRDELDLRGELLAASTTGPERFIEWATGPVLYKPRMALRWVVRLLTLLTVLLIAGLLTQGVPRGGWLVLIGLIAVNILVNAFFVGSIHDLFNRITAGGNELRHYSALFELLSSLPGDSPRLARLREQLDDDDVSFRQAFKELNRIMRWGGGRKSSIFGIPYVFIQVLVFWDFHVLVWLERWQERCGHCVGSWFDAVAELEALASLATVAADHPEWTYPKVNCGSEKFAAGQLGHPLLPLGECSANDVQLGPPGTFLLITGSNMSGKSTLLRAIGVNAILRVRVHRFAPLHCPCPPSSWRPACESATRWTTAFRSSLPS